MLINENRVLREEGYVKNPHNLPETQIADGYIAPESQAAYRKMLCDMRSGAATVNGEFWMYRNLNPDDKHCISISYTLDFDSNGNVISASGLGLDITEQKNVESLHQKQIENLMNMYPDALGSFKMNLTQDYVTSQKRLHSFIEFQGDRLSIDEYFNGMKENLIEDEFQRYAEIFSRKRLTNPVTKELEVYVFAVDVSEKMLNEQMIQKLINSRYDIIALIYPKEGYVDFRYSGNEFQDIPEISIEEYDRNRLQSSQLFGEGQDQEYMRYTQLDRIIKHLDAEDIYSFTMSRMLDGKKCYKRYSYNYLTEDHDIIISTVQDITNLMEKEEAQVKVIQNALAEDEKANAAKTAFLSNMSHDIRTPMNAIINMTKMAEEDIHIPEKALDDLQKIKISSDFLLSLINDVLDMAKIDSGKMEFQPEVYEYKDFLNYIDSIFTPLCKNKDIHFVWNHLDNSVPIYVDILRINQMFFNLLSNAVKYTPPGGTVTYDIQNKVITDELLDCDFIISDTGQGMSKEFQEKMFQPFEREINRAGGQQGTGLGLAIVKSTVDMMGGTIQVESETGKGTTFRIHLKLPIATKEQVAAKEEKYRNVENLPLEGKRVLVAEDHPINREIMKRLLERRKVSIDIAEDGKACVDLYDSHDSGYYDTILMDVRMPIMNGIEATREIRALPREDARTIPIIAMTANAFAQDRILATEAGMSAYLSKPVDAQELYQTLAHTMYREGSPK